MICRRSTNTGLPLRNSDRAEAAALREAMITELRTGDNVRSDPLPARSPRYRGMCSRPRSRWSAPTKGEAASTPFGFDAASQDKILVLQW